MNFSFSDDQVLLKNSVRAALEEHCKSSHVRAMAEDGKGYSDELWGEMGKLGWLGLPFPEEHGGAGLGLVELAIVLEEMGRAAYPGPFFSTVVLGGLGLMLGSSADQKDKWLPAIASGRARMTAALLEEHLDWEPASTTASATRWSRPPVSGSPPKRSRPSSRCPPAPRAPSPSRRSSAAASSSRMRPPIPSSPPTCRPP